MNIAFNVAILKIQILYNCCLASITSWLPETSDMQHILIGPCLNSLLSSHNEVFQENMK